MSNARQEVITQNGVFGNVCRVTTNIRMRKKFFVTTSMYDVYDEEQRLQAVYQIMFIKSFLILEKSPQQ